MDRQEWERHTHEEIAFWDQWFSARGGQWPEDYLRRIDPQQRLPELIEKSLAARGVERGSTVRILDLGSGPLTYVGSRSDRYAVEVVAIDPLAVAYNALIERHGVAVPVRPQGEAERLECLFPAGTFDLVWARNSLDHSYDPLLGIFQALRTVKVGGSVLLVFHPNEADQGNYQGLHNWNFDIRNGAFVIEQHDRIVDVSRLLGRGCEIRIPHTVSRGSKSNINVELVKQADLGLFELVCAHA